MYRYLCQCSVFAWININKGQCLLPQSGTPPNDGTGTGYIGGQIGGPVVLHQDTWHRGPPGNGSSGKPAAVIALPLEAFKHSILALHTGGAAAGDGALRYGWLQL